MKIIAQVQKNIAQCKLLIYRIVLKIMAQAKEFEMKQLCDKYGFHSSVSLANCSLVGNIQIGEYTYANNGTTFSSGEHSKVIIGKHCAIGRYVHITSKAHSFEIPTSDEKYTQHKHIEADTIIGNYVWIGDHVFIKHGVTISDYAIIGANSVVTKDVKPFEIVGGVPAKHIRFNTEHYKNKELY